MIVDDGQSELDTSAIDDQPVPNPAAAAAATIFEVHADTP